MTALFRNIITSGARRFIGLQPSQSYLSDGFANWPPSASLQPYLMLASNDMRNNPNKPFLSPQALDWFNHAIASAEYENGEDCHLSSLAIAELVAAQLLRFYLTGTPPCHQVVHELSGYWGVIERVSTEVNDDVNKYQWDEEMFSLTPYLIFR